jgi:nicotinamidase/pyrazinamidase
MDALIVTDMQNDFLPGGALPVPDGDGIVPLVNQLQGHFELVVATQDWHPPGHASFASSHPGKKPLDKVTVRGVEQVLWPDHCVQGGIGAAFVPTLSMNRVEAIFRKGTNPEIDSYSAFFDNAHLKSTGLEGYLKEKDVDRIFLCGLAADYCVYYSAKDALAAGFGVVLIRDATRPISEDAMDTVEKDILAGGGTLILGQEILKIARL